MDFVRAVALGVLALGAGCGVVAWATSQWTSLSSHWINSGLVFPVLGLLGGLGLAKSSTGAGRNRLRLALALVASVLGTAGNFLAFVITSRTWFADRIPPEHQSLVYQLLHPDVLPTFVSKGSTGSGAEQTWKQQVVIGLIACPLIFWYSSRQDTPEQ